LNVEHDLVRPKHEDVVVDERSPTEFVIAVGQQVVSVFGETPPPAAGTGEEQVKAEVDREPIGGKSGEPVSAVDDALDEVERWFRAQSDHLEELFGEAIRQAIDEVLDGARTGRFLVSDLETTEKTYIGTKIEIVVRSALGLQREGPLDTLVAGHTVDIKWSATQGWMIPTEALDELCLLVGTRSSAPLVFDVGLLRCTAERLTKRPNRDKKRTISAAGKRHIRWLIQGGVLQPNFLATLDDDVCGAVLAESSGQAKVRRLFTLLVGTPIPRDAIETLAQQRDPMRRLRSDQSDRLPGLKIFSSHYSDNQLAVRLLGYGDMPRDTFVAVPRDRLSELPEDLRQRLGMESDAEDDEAGDTPR